MQCIEYKVQENSSEYNIRVFFLQDEFGDEASRSAVAAQMPEKIKRRRRRAREDGEEAEWEEYFDYVFPDVEGNQPNLRLLAMAARWKQTQQKKSTAEEEEESEEESEESEESDNEKEEKDGENEDADTDIESGDGDSEEAEEEDTWSENSVRGVNSLHFCLFVRQIQTICIRFLSFSSERHLGYLGFDLLLSVATCADIKRRAICISYSWVVILVKSGIL